MTGSVRSPGSNCTQVSQHQLPQPHTPSQQMPQTGLSTQAAPSSPSWAHPSSGSSMAAPTHSVISPAALADQEFFAASVVEEVRAIIRAAFEYAVAHDRPSVTLCDKSNALRFGHDLWQRVFAEVSREYDDIDCVALTPDDMYGAPPIGPGEALVGTFCLVVPTDIAEDLTFFIEENQSSTDTRVWWSLTG